MPPENPPDDWDRWRDEVEDGELSNPLGEFIPWLFSRRAAYGLGKDRADSFRQMWRGFGVDAEILFLFCDRDIPAIDQWRTFTIWAEGGEWALIINRKRIPIPEVAEGAQWAVYEAAVAAGIKVRKDIHTP